MSKKDTFQNIIRFELVKALRDVYNMKSSLTESQEKLVGTVSERLYILFGESMTVKELQEKVDAISKTV